MNSPLDLHDQASGIRAVILGAAVLLLGVVARADGPRASIEMTNARNGAVPSAPCAPQVIPTFGPAVGADGSVNALAIFDDGRGGGPALYAGGSFTQIGGITIKGIARWNGSYWSAVGSGMGGTSPSVRALTVFDDGSGPALFAAGVFTSAGGVPANRIAKWNGTTWSALGTGLSSTADDMLIFDDGTGPALYVAGNFQSAGGVVVKYIARWNGTNWSSVGGGTNDRVDCLAIHDDGSGLALFAGGHFTKAGGIDAYNIARWNGSTWAPVGLGMNLSVEGLEVFDEGGPEGPVLVASGFFTIAGGQPAAHIAQWNGTNWLPMGTGVDNAASGMGVFDDGTGPALFVGGGFEHAGGVPAHRVARWKNGAWSGLGAGTSNSPSAFLVHDDGSGAGVRLFMGGGFETADGMTVNRIATWNGTSWSAVGHGLNRTVDALHVFEDGSRDGGVLCIGGKFTTAGGGPVGYAVKWDGQSFSSIGGGFSSFVYAFAVANTGMGTTLNAGGAFYWVAGQWAHHIARWGGTDWMPVGGGFSGDVYALAVYDADYRAGPALFAGGVFNTGGWTTGYYVSRWNGLAWEPLGNSLSSEVYAMTVFDDALGGGPGLYVGGSFSSSGSLPLARVARWNGTAWSALGAGTNGQIHAMAVFDDGLGDGPALYVAGTLTAAGGAPASRIARWNGVAWSPLGSGIGGDDDPIVKALAVYDDGTGSGPALFAAGEFSAAGGMPANNLAKWDGIAWTPIDLGVNDGINALCVYDDGTGPSLYAGGYFETSAAGDGYIARWRGCVDDCNGDGIPDWIQISEGALIDTDDDGVPDCCELESRGPCPDLDGNGAVDGTDLAIVLGHWLSDPSAFPAADLDSDGAIDGGDLSIVLGGWGLCPCH